MNNKLVVIAALGLTALLAPPSWSQTGLKPGGSLWIEGDSTLHRWSSSSTAVELTLTPADALIPAAVTGAEARIPVASLKSGENGLDKNMRKAMNAEKFPEVRFTLASYASPQATGVLEIAGTTRTVTMPIEFVPAPDGLHAKGSYALKMSDYGIAPPKLFMGTIKVRDAVTVRFDLILNSKKEKPQ